MATQTSFSAKATIVTFIVHFCLTYVFAGWIFITAMGSFTENVTDEMAFWNKWMWIWTPLARALFKVEDLNFWNLHLLAFVWSMVVGLIVGLMAECLGRYPRLADLPD
ncbi:hypothetical protein [Prosthecobacter dejongeii]|uniref:Transmembrane protein n=1 Tax=Prosthecobacter dejongeii TaxID=48465 RepID=A0A7W7YIT7_9BACT|nr:hypothetical protein [Prosthecobacter dejongeii]MBB5036998.1 hypothetical protein [Prosthecobacter dejongeii]